MNWFPLNKSTLLSVTFLIISFYASAWGFYAHRLINEKAVYALPNEMFGFYKSNIDYISEHAVDPDKRRYAVKEEGPRHYIDLDHYFENTDSNAFEIIRIHVPIYWDSAVSKYSEDSLNNYGILPWYLNLMVYRLTNAFLNSDAGAILKLSAEIGHYAADAHVPLHTTENYNGQLTGQKGIHALWESRIPERKAKNYLFLNEGANYLDNIQYDVWKVIAQSHNLVPFVLTSEKELRSTFDEDKVYRPSTVGRKVVPQYTSAYVESYSLSNGMLVERRMKEAAHFISSLWYTAWVNAGQPKLYNISEVPMMSIEKESDPESDHIR